MPVMNTHKFETRTGLSGEWKYGNKIAVVWAALKDYDEVRHSPDEGKQLAALRMVAKSAAWWLANKKTKEKNQTKARKKVIEDLLDEAIAEIGAIDEAEALYARRKCEALKKNWVHAIIEKPLIGRVKIRSVTADESPYRVNVTGGYAHERTDYLKNKKKSNPISGTKMHTAFKSSTHGGKDADWEKIKYGEFRKLVEIYQKNNNGRNANALVEYYKREDRLKWLLSCDEGVYSYLSGQSLADEQKGNKDQKDSSLYKYPMMYAMDRYGNLYARDFSPAKKDTDTNQFNHTSFCAGNEVVCAGSILFNDKGHLVYISNYSGHYIPSEDALRRALRFIAKDGVDLSKVCIGLNGDDGKYVAKDFKEGTKVPWDPKLNKGLQMSDAVGG